MKFVKIFFGILVCLFVLMHLVEGVMKFGTVSGSLATSWWMGKAIAVILGSVIATAFFRSAAGDDKSGQG